MENIELLIDRNDANNEDIVNVSEDVESVLDNIIKSASKNDEFMANYNKNSITSLFIIENRNQVEKLVYKYFGIPESMKDLWTIYDYIDDKENDIKLVLVHYVQANNYFDPNNPEHEILKPLRGVVFDLTRGTLVANTQGYVDEIVTEKPVKIKDLGYETNVIVNDVSYTDARLYMGYDSVFIKVFKNTGRVYLSTVRKINAVKSKWGYSKHFREVFDELSGFDIEDLFGRERHSPYCYYFILNDTDLTFATSLNDRRLYYAGVGTMWRPGTYDLRGVIPKVANVPNMMYNAASRPQYLIGVYIANKVLFPYEFAEKATTYMDENIDMNVHLKPNQMHLKYIQNNIMEVYINPEYPNTKDNRIKGGEFIIMAVPVNEEGRKTTKYYRIESEAYSYRKKLLGGDPEPYHRFFETLVDIYRGKEKLEGYPDVDVDMSNIDYSLFSDNDYQSTSGQTRYLILKWNKLFVDAISPQWKEYASKFIRKFNKNIVDVTFYIVRVIPILIKRIKKENFNVKEILDPLIYQKMKGAYEYNIYRNEEEKVESVHLFLLYTLNKGILYKMISEVNKLIKFGIYKPPTDSL